MKEVYNHPDPSRVGYYKSLLEDAEITCFIRNEFADGSIFGGGGVPMFNPTLCVADPADFRNACLMIQAHEYPEPLEGDDWTCPNCSQEVPAGFDVCWNCDYSEAQ